MAGEAGFLASRFGGMVSLLLQLWRSCGWPGFEAVMPFPYEQETCCILAGLPGDPLTDL